MLSNASMVRNFLADALSTTSYLVNRSSSTVIRGWTPKKL